MAVFIVHSDFEAQEYEICHRFQQQGVARIHHGVEHVGQAHFHAKQGKSADKDRQKDKGLLPSCSRQEGLVPCFVWKGFPTFPAHLRMRPVSRKFET